MNIDILLTIQTVLFILFFIGVTLAGAFAIGAMVSKLFDDEGKE